MGKNKIKTLLMACVMMMTCTAMVVTGTYSLWSSESSSNQHLEAGNLQVTLTRTYLEKYVLGDDSYMTTVNDPNEVVVTDENFFGMEEGEVVVPTSSYAAKLKLKNNGSVAVSYTVSIVVGEDSDAELASQVKVYFGSGAVGSVTYDEGRYLASGTTPVLESNIDVGSGVLDASQTETEFWVKLVFESGNGNNAAQNKTANFDLKVSAVQKTE